jgi:hypothetical protein
MLERAAGRCMDRATEWSRNQCLSGTASR